MLRLALATLACGGFVMLGAWEAQACRIPCACLDVDKDGIEDDLVCCGAEGFDLADSLNEQQACGKTSVAPVAGLGEPLVEIAGRISPDGVMGCGCLDVDRDGTAEVVETSPPVSTALARRQWRVSAVTSRLRANAQVSSPTVSSANEPKGGDRRC